MNESMEYFALGANGFEELLPECRSVMHEAGSLPLSRRGYLLGSAALIAHLIKPLSGAVAAQPAERNVARLNGSAGGRRFDGIGVVNGGGATSVLLKDYPEPQRSQIMDLLYKPKFGASVSALLVEIPGDGNSTQGSMPSHMHTRGDLNYDRGYIWWILKEAKKRNPMLSLDATAWSAPGWIGSKESDGIARAQRNNADFWSKDAVEYYMKWLEGLRSVHGLELDAIGCRNEKGTNVSFAKALKKALLSRNFEKVKLHAFDNWGAEKLDFVSEMLRDKELQDSIDVISAHTFSEIPASSSIIAAAGRMSKPIWNTEDHVYRKGFDCAISIVNCFNRNYLESGATKIVIWYDIGGLYPVEPYSEDPPAVLAWEPWSGHYRVREALWGYAHYGQFSEIGWTYLNGGSGMLHGGGTFVTLISPDSDYNVILETREASINQTFRLEIAGGLSNKPLCVWKSNAAEQFVRQSDLVVQGGGVTLTLEPNTIYSLSTTRGQRKGGFESVPSSRPFPLPYAENFKSYTEPKRSGYLPRFTADILGAFELTDRPDKKPGNCLRQVVPMPTLSWAPEWQPYTIIGDRDWSNYEISADVWLNPGDTAGVMGRINHVGTGYGVIPKGYYLELRHTGECRLVVIRGKKDPKELVGDAEQRRLIAAGKFEGEGGELVLASGQTAPVAGKWVRLMLRLEGETLSGLVNGRPVVSGTSRLYMRGMPGLMAGQEAGRTSTPYFDNLLINVVRGSRRAGNGTPTD
jgi:galactosylceramidase